MNNESSYFLCCFYILKMKKASLFHIIWLIINNGNDQYYCALWKFWPMNSCRCKCMWCSQILAITCLHHESTIFALLSQLLKKIELEKCILFVPCYCLPKVVHMPYTDSKWYLPFQEKTWNHKSLEKHAPLDWNMGLVHGTIGSIAHDRDYHQ